MWFFRDMLHSKSTFFVNTLFFHHWQNVFCGRVQMASQIRFWPAGRGAVNLDIDYEEEWWQHTPLSESNTNTERLWFDSVDMDTIFWAGIQFVTAGNISWCGTLLNATFTVQDVWHKIHGLHEAARPSSPKLLHTIQWYNPRCQPEKRPHIRMEET